MAGGRGIHVVAATAGDWGFERTPQGKTVWATIPVQAAVDERITPAESEAPARATTGTDTENLRRLRSVTDPELASLGFDEMLNELLDRVTTALGADAAAVLLLDSDSDELVVTAAKGIELDARQGVRVPVGKGFSGRVAACAETVTLDGLDEVELIGRSLRRMGLRRMLGVPMMAGGRVTGVVHVGRCSIETFDDHDADLLRVVAERVAAAAVAHEAIVDREAAMAIQRSLLPPRLLPVEGLSVAARYLPGKAGLVSGDWYDLIRFDESRVGLAIGDVVGSGLRAALVMGRLRSALRSYTLETFDPADVLERLDRKAHHFEAGQMTTVLYAVVDVPTGRVDIASAGHPPSGPRRTGWQPSADRAAGGTTTRGSRRRCSIVGRRSRWRQGRCCSSTPMVWSSVATPQSETVCNNFSTRLPSVIQTACATTSSRPCSATASRPTTWQCSPHDALSVIASAECTAHNPLADLRR